MDETPREKFLIAIAGGASLREAARVSGYDLETGRKILKRPDVMRKLEELKVRAPAKEPNKDEELALKVLREMAVEAEEEKDRIAAAKALLNHGKNQRQVAAPLAPVIQVLPPDPARDEAEAKAWREKKA